MPKNTTAGNTLAVFIPSDLCFDHLGNRAGEETLKEGPGPDSFCPEMNSSGLPVVKPMLPSWRGQKYRTSTKTNLQKLEKNIKQDYKQWKEHGSPSQSAYCTPFWNVAVRWKCTSHGLFTFFICNPGETKRKNPGHKSS